MNSSIYLSRKWSLYLSNIDWLASGVKQQTIAEAVGLNQAQISRFAAKYKKQIELQKINLEFQWSMGVLFGKSRQTQPQAQNTQTHTLSPALMKLFSECGLLAGKAKAVGD